MNLNLVKLSILTIYFILVTAQANAQKVDFVITAKGDTLAGTVVGILFTSVKFKELTGTTFTKFTPYQIKEIRTKKQVYVSKQLPYEMEPLFLKRIENGSISLYEYLKTTGAAGETYIKRWYASKNQEPLIELKTNWGANSSRKERKEAFEELIRDDAELLALYKSQNSFEQNFLRTLIRKYNNKALAKN